VLERLYGRPLSEASVDAAALSRLAQEPVLDYIVLDRDIGVPCLASNGKVYVHDCRQLRSCAAR